MKSLVTVFTILLISIWLAPQFNGSSVLNAQNEMDTVPILDEEMRIKSAVEKFYIEGLKTRNFDLITTICIPEAVLMSSGRDENLHITTLEKWSKRFDPGNPPFQKLDFCITNIDREGTAAQVKILFVVDEKSQVTDYLHMLKLEGKWRIVNIIDY